MGYSDLPSQLFQYWTNLLLSIGKLDLPIVLAPSPNLRLTSPSVSILDNRYLNYVTPASSLYSLTLSEAFIFNLLFICNLNFNHFFSGDINLEFFIN